MVLCKSMWRELFVPLWRSRGRTIDGFWPHVFQMCCISLRRWFQKIYSARSQPYGWTLTARQLELGFLGTNFFSSRPELANLFYRYFFMTLINKPPRLHWTQWVIYLAFIHITLPNSGGTWFECSRLDYSFSQLLNSYILAHALHRVSRAENQHILYIVPNNYQCHLAIFSKISQPNHTQCNFTSPKEFEYQP